MPDPITMEETPEEIQLNEIKQQPDFQQITVQEYSAETQLLPKKILIQTRQVHQSSSLGKRVDTVRQWEPIWEEGKVTGYKNKGSKLEVKTKMWGEKK